MPLYSSFGDSYNIRPSRILDQQFGTILNPEDFSQPMNRYFLFYPAGYKRNWKSAASKRDSGSTVTYGLDEYLVNLDVQQFKPDEISVTVTAERAITVEGKHEEKEDEHGHIFRHFIRKYNLPEQYDVNKIESKLSSDGILSIAAPKLDPTQITYTNIPVAQTGQPAKEEGAGEKK